MSDGPKLVTLNDANHHDIPVMLRRLADSIERGKYGAVKMVASVLFREDLSATTFGWGRCNFLEVVGAFQRATLLDESGFRADSENVDG